MQLLYLMHVQYDRSILIILKTVKNGCEAINKNIIHYENNYTLNI